MQRIQTLYQKNLHTILHGWNFVRALRLFIGVMIIFQAMANNDILFALLGAILLVQALFKVGCCGVSACNIVPAPKTESSDVEFIEIKK